jgi:hypothetical protein
MPTIYTGTANIPFQAGYKAGKTAREMYNEEKAREDARLKAQMDLQQEQLNFTKQKAEYDHLEQLTKLAQEKVKGDTELMLNQKEKDDKRKQWALEKIYDKYGENTDLNNPDIQKEFLSTYSNANQIFNSDLSSMQESTQGQPQGQPPTPEAVTDDKITKPLTVEERKNEEKLKLKLDELSNLAVSKGVILNDEEENLPALDKIKLLRNKISEKPQREEIRQNEANQRQLERMLPKLNQEVQGQNEVLKKINQLEEKVGFKLEDYDSQDIEGINLPLVGRVNISEASKEIQNILTGILNSKIYDSSGKAITDNEFKRIADEMGISKGSLFSTEKNMLEALKRFKEAVILKAQNTELSYPDSVIEHFVKRGGKLLSRQTNTETSEQSTETDPEYEQMLKLASGGK